MLDLFRDFHGPVTASELPLLHNTPNLVSLRTVQYSSTVFYCELRSESARLKLESAVVLLSTLLLLRDYLENTLQFWPPMCFLNSLSGPAVTGNGPPFASIVPWNIGSEETCSLRRVSSTNYIDWTSA